MIEAMKQWLEALEKSLPRLAPYGEQDWLDSKAAITSLRQAIADLESQEPVAWNRGVPPVRPQQKEGETFIVSYEDTNPPQRTEPVATVTSETGADITMSWWHEPALPVGTKLFTYAPQRTWVGLTDKEISQCVALNADGFIKPLAFYKAIEAKLRELNT